MKVTLYALSTCGWCRRTKHFLNENKIPYQCFDVDLLQGEERERARSEVAKHNPRRSYPTLVIDDGAKVIVGFDEVKLREGLGL